jgi:hypothetical protein
MFVAATASFQTFASEHTFGAAADPYCPRLPEHSGYEWEWVFSIDAGDCVGRVAKTHKEAFAFAITRLYGAMAPGLMEPETSFVQTGNVGGTPVRWYRASRHRGPERLEYRTFTLLYEEKMAYLSVSVYAKSESQMAERLGVLERMTFR